VFIVINFRFEFCSPDLVQQNKSSASLLNGQSDLSNCCKQAAVNRLFGSGRWKSPEAEAFC